MIFYLNLPVGLLAVIVVGLFFHERRSTRQHALDIAGASYLTFLLTSTLLVLIEGGQAWPWISVPSALLVLVALVSLILFIREEQRVAEPALPLDLFRSRIIAVSALGMFFAGAIMVSVSFEVPLFAQGVLGQDALHAGFALAPMSIGWPLAGAFSGRLALRFGYRRTAISGLLFILAGVSLLLTLDPESAVGTASGFSFLIGVGLGLSSTPMLIAVQSAVAWARRGVATASNMFVRSFGGVVGLAVMGAIVNHVTGRYGGSSATNQALDVHAHHVLPRAVVDQIHSTLFHSIHDTFIAALVATVLGLIVVCYLPGGSARQYEVQEATPATRSVNPSPEA